MVYTEFISSDGLIRNGKKSEDKLKILDKERPIGIQIYGHIPEAMVEAARIAEQAGPDVIDINFGCPVKKIARRGAGAGILRDIPLMIDITRKVVKATSLPVTVKTRISWDEKSEAIDEIAEKLQDTGIQALTIHGRTGKQMYRGEADWTLIGKVKNNPRIKIPIIGNGDITSPEKAYDHINKYGIDAIMIGRATIGRPWIFDEIRNYLENKTVKPYDISEKVDIISNHLKKSVLRKGERIGILLMRRHLASYFKNLPHFREIKIRLLTTENYHEVTDILEEIRLKYAGY
jgi:nifR3 family TIM-barrel protein